MILLILMFKVLVSVIMVLNFGLSLLFLILLMVVVCSLVFLVREVMESLVVL